MDGVSNGYHCQKATGSFTSGNNTQVKSQNSFLDGPSNFMSEFSPPPPPYDTQKATDLFRSDKGKELRNNLSTILDDLNNQGKKLLKEKSENLITTEYRTYLSILIGGSVITFLAILISIITSLSITNPIKTLIAATENITKHNYQKPINLVADRDLDVLIH